jgi:hypothetical protein
MRWRRHFRLPKMVFDGGQKKQVVCQTLCFDESGAGGGRPMCGPMMLRNPGYPASDQIWPDNEPTE